MRSRAIFSLALLAAVPATASPLRWRYPPPGYTGQAPTATFSASGHALVATYNTMSGVWSAPAPAALACWEPVAITATAGSQFATGNAREWPADPLDPATPCRCADHTGDGRVGIPDLAGWRGVAWFGLWSRCYGR